MQQTFICQRSKLLQHLQNVILLVALGTALLKILKL